MAGQREFYETRAIAERGQAEAAILANVRDCHLRAAVAWEGMADRAGHTERCRAETDARKLVERAEAAALAAAG